MKPNYHLIPPRVLEEVAKVFTHGAAKHDEFGWLKAPESQSHMYSCAQRHQQEWRVGKKADDEFGTHPLAHAITRLMMLMAYDLNETEWKDGPRPVGDKTASEVNQEREVSDYIQKEVEKWKEAARRN